MIDPFRARMYRLILGFAAAYNIGFGLWTALWPRSFFDVFEMAPPRYPSIWACLGMVVGLYGAVYALAAARLHVAKPLVAIGLAGKVLGPAGWLLAVRSGEWPVRTFTLITFNDLIWWVPFTLLLLEGTRAGERLRASAPYACALCNAAGALALLAALRPGSEVEPDPARRALYIAENPGLWRAGWLAWYAAATSLLGFYAWWAARLPRVAWGIAAWSAAAAGIVCDLLAESLYIGWLPDRLEQVQRIGTLLTGGAANGLYTAAGVALTLSTPSLPLPLRVAAWAIWVFGFALTVSAWAASTAGMVVATAGLMALLCPWAWFMGKKLE
ncbi:MAG: hypothetical protein DMG07_23800 [Acidobacteria bacterium]|nr:MAG: hypothetical protein DMG07_23800 [Acidobacteriota bacterium]